jgi:hypothetical protein
MLKFVLLFSVLAFFRAEANDWVYLRPEAGMGYSDNVYQDDFNKKSDWFFWLSGAAKLQESEATWAGKVSLNLYSKEDANNYGVYLIKRTSRLQNIKSDLTFGLGGLNYLEKNKGSTDESFNNVYFTSYLIRSLKENTQFSVYAEPGVRITSYPDLDRRLDSLVYFAVNSIWRYRPVTEINPYGELGFLFSNQGYYSKNYIDIGIAWNEKISDKDRFSLDYFMRNSIYVNRKVSDILFVPNRSGRVTSRSVETRETSGLRQLTASLTHTVQEIDLTAGISHANESSSSDLEHYEENKVYASATVSL